MKTITSVRARRSILLLGAMMLAASGCRRADPAPPPAAPATIRPIDDLDRLKPVSVGEGTSDHCWIAHVTTADVDQDGRLDILACDARENAVVWLRQLGGGKFSEQVILSSVPAPVHAEACDIDGDGDFDVLVASMGQVFPNNDRIGSIIVLENDGSGRFTRRTIAENVMRVNDVRAADLNNDGRLDLAVAQFGYDQGQVCWMENLGNGSFAEHPLLDLSGAINVAIADMNGDGKPDVVALVSQQWEEVHLFENDGAGNFTRRVIWGSTNEDYGSSGMVLGDLNGDGRPDVIHTNGDGFGPAVLPGPRPWHRVQWLENRGDGNFRYHRIGDLPGAYSPVLVDLDRDGRMDVVAGSAYADGITPGVKAASLVWFRNDGSQEFTPHILAFDPKDQITVAAADLDGDGWAELISGGFYVAPPYERMGRLTVWNRTGKP